MRRKFRFSTIYIALVLTVMYLPLVVVVLFSFNSTKLSTVWTGFSLMWYQKLFSDRVLLEALKNSLILASLSSLISVVIGTLGAIGLQRAKSRLGRITEQTSVLPIMIPEIILGMVFLSFFSLLGLKFGMLTLVIAHCSFCVPYIFMMVKGSLANLNHSLEDAALDLGAGSFQVLRDIILPHILPAAASGMLLSFAMSLDDVVISFFVTGAQVNTLPVKIYSQLKVGVTPEINALCTVMLGVTFLLVALSGMIGKKSR